MALFCAAIGRDSVSLLRFPFLSQVQIFWYEISLVCHLKCPYNCFSSHFCFLVIVVLLILVLFVLFLVTYYYYYYCYFLRVFHTSVSWWSFTGVLWQQVFSNLLWSWRPEETCNHSDSCEIPSANAGIKNSQGVK